MPGAVQIHLDRDLIAVAPDHSAWQRCFLVVADDHLISDLRVETVIRPAGSV